MDVDNAEQLRRPPGHGGTPGQGEQFHQIREVQAVALARQREFSEALGRRIMLKTALVDVLGATHFMRVPVMIEYDEYKKLQSYAVSDGLTGLYNRRLFDETCDRELTRSKRYNQQLAVVMFDLRHLKEVNDQYGHLTGSRAICRVADVLRQNSRSRR